jgi:hypothetical protein
LRPADIPDCKDVGRSMWQIIVATIIRRHGVSEIMIPFLAMHALAASRGDGLRPELLALFERIEADSSPHLIVDVSDQHLADAAETANPRPMSGKVAA